MFVCVCVCVLVVLVVVGGGGTFSGLPWVIGPGDFSQGEEKGEEIE